MSGYNVILLTDTPEHPAWCRGYGAHRIANQLRANGYTCLVLDFTSDLTFSKWQEICNLAVGDETLVVGISTTWWPYRKPSSPSKDSWINSRDNLNLIEPKSMGKDGALEAAKSGMLEIWFDTVKQINPKVKFLLGGPKVEFYFDAPVDHFIIGLGETQIIDYIQSLKESKRIWPRVINHDTNAGAPSWDFKHSQTLYTSIDQIKPYEILNFEFSRGCRFKCSFCSYPLIGMKDVSSYIKSKDTIYSELMHNYENWGTTQYVVADDTLNDSTQKLEHIASAIRQLPFKPKFKAYTRLDVIAVNPVQATLLHEIGLANTWMGIDSFHPTAAKSIGKGMPASRRKEMLYNLKEIWGNDVTITAGYIVGLPGEDVDHLYSVAEWLSKKDNPIYSTTFMGLRIMPPKPLLPYTPRSDIDNNYKEYGYDIPNLEKFWEWTKNDQTGISNYLDAEMYANKLNDMIPKQPNPPNMQNDPQVLKSPSEWYFKPLIEQLRLIKDRTV